MISFDWNQEWNPLATIPKITLHTGPPANLTLENPLTALSLSTHQDSPRTCLDRYSSPPEPSNQFIPSRKWPSSQWNSKVELLPFWLVISQPTNHATD